jgi:hypothetical protein
VQIKSEVTIERPRDEVFRRFVDELAITYPLVCPVTASVTLDKPIAVGVIGQMTVKNLFMSAVIGLTVTRYEKGERFSLDARNRGRSAQSDYLFRDAGTRTTLTMVTELPAIGPRWLQRLNRRSLERHDRSDAQRLKALLEGRQKDPAKAYRQSMMRVVLIGLALAALLGIAFATYQALTS